MKQKKNIPILLITLLFFSTSRAQNIDNGLIAFYSFDKDPSSNVDLKIKDGSRYNNDGTYIGNPTFVEDRYGVDCRAIFFDGDSYVTIPDSRSLSSPTTQFTATVWVKIADGADFFKQWLTILCKSDNSLETVNSPHYRVQATAQTVSLNTEFTEDFIPQLSYDTWYFYAYVYDGNIVRVYLDGLLAFEYNYSGRLYPNSMPLEIGRDLPGVPEYFNGAMDELRIYKRALLEHEIVQLYLDDSGIGQPSACSDNSFEEITNTTTKDTNDYVITIPHDDPSYKDTIKEEEIVEQVPNIKDSIPKTYEDLPKTIDKIPIEYQNTIIVKNRNIRIYLYDNEKEDGDVVAININGVWVRKRLRIKLKRPKPYDNHIIKVRLNEGDNNYIISKALNIGSIPPNTLTLEIDDGVSKQELVINSDKGTSGGIRIISNAEYSQNDLNKEKP